MNATKRLTSSSQSRTHVDGDRRPALELVCAAALKGNQMHALLTVMHWVGRALRAFVFMKWEPIPYFGFALTGMLLFWVYLAIMR